MGFLNNFFKNQSTKAKHKGLSFMISVFDNTIGTKRKDSGEIGFGKIVIYSLVIVVGISVIFKIFDIIEKYLPYAIGVLVLLIIISRKQIQAFVSKKINIASVKEDLPSSVQKLKQKLVEDKNSYAKGVVLNARLEEIPKKERFAVKGPRKGLKIAYVEQIEEIVATVKVQKGRLKIGDALKAHYSIWGWHDCKVSRIYNENGDKIKFAEAGQTVSITGFYKLFSKKNIDIDKLPIDGKKFEAYDDSLQNYSE